MVPAAAQRFRDRAASGVGTAAWLHRDDGVVRKRVTIHEEPFNRSAIESALQRRHYVEQKVAAGADCDFGVGLLVPMPAHPYGELSGLRFAVEARPVCG
jgi:hypothetical protein